MTQNGSLQEAPRSLWGSLPIKAAQLGQTEKAGPRDVRRIVLEEGSTPQPWCIEWGGMLWAPRELSCGLALGLWMSAEKQTPGNSTGEGRTQEKVEL